MPSLPLWKPTGRGAHVRILRATGVITTALSLLMGKKPGFWRQRKSTGLLKELQVYFEDNKQTVTFSLNLKVFILISNTQTVRMYFSSSFGIRNKKHLQ